MSKRQVVMSSTVKDLGEFGRAVITKVERLDGNLYLTRRHHRSNRSLGILTRRATLFMVLKKLRRFIGEKVFDPFNQESIAPRAIHLRVIARASGVELFLARERFDKSAVVQPVIVKLEKLFRLLRRPSRPKQHRDFHKTERRLTSQRSGDTAQARKKRGLKFLYSP